MDGRFGRDLAQMRWEVDFGRRCAAVLFAAGTGLLAIGMVLPVGFTGTAALVLGTMLSGTGLFIGVDAELTRRSRDRLVARAESLDGWGGR